MSKNNPKPKELVKNYRKSGMNPIFKEEPEKAREFLEMYSKIRESAKYMIDAEDKQVTKADVDSFYDKTVRCREIVEDWILKDKDSLQDKECQLMKQRAKERRVSDSVDDVKQYFRYCRVFEGFLMSDYLINDLIDLGGP
jgi:hypothetical protein